MDGVKIRDFELNDVMQVQSIYAFHVLNGLGTFEEVVPSANEMSNRIKEILSAGYPVLVAEHNGEILGYCYVNLFRVRSAYRYTVEDSIYINPKHQGKNLGSLLLNELIEKCKFKQFKQILAFIGDSKNVGSINLHKKFGFTQVGIMKDVGYKFEKWVDVVIMQLNLVSSTP